MTVVLLIALILTGLGAALLAVRASRLGGEAGRMRDERDSALGERDELAAEAARLPEAEQKLASVSARLEAIEAERDRLLEGDEGKLSETHKHVGDLRRDLDEIKQQKLPQLLDHSSKAASGAERVEDRMTGWMRTIANPQARGAFGELAVENQLRNLGLELGRDYFRQVPGEDGRKRADYVVRTREGSVVIDAKFVLDEDAEDLENAIQANDPERLVGFGRKLKARAEDLSKRDYSKVAGRGPSVVLLYVPVEGAYEALRALPDFSLEKFTQKHRVYVVTPSQLGLALGLIAEVTHKARYEEQVGDVADALVEVAEQIADLVDGLDQHGKHLQTAFKSYDGLLSMTSSRSKLWRRASVVWDFARRRPKLEGEVRELDPPRTDAGEIAERWREAAEG
ncbi:MAG TPA: DNA recombination protein RmuC [Solirubrobacterales bacterium]|jgi:DNA anti-recombination protein RmuC